MNQQQLRRWYAVGIGVVVFLLDWSGFNKWEPDLFFPKPLRQVWWHLPLEIAVIVAIFRLLELLDRRSNGIGIIP
jgi:hypothetical protein